MEPYTECYLANLPYQSYPTILTAAVTSVSHGTAINYHCPLSIVSDLWPFLSHSDTRVHCVITQFLSSENHFILVLVPFTYDTGLIYSPRTPVSNRPDQ